MGLRFIEVSAVDLLDPPMSQLDVYGRCQSVLGQRCLHTAERTSIDRDDGATCLRGFLRCPNEFGYMSADAGNARHLCVALSVQPYGEVIGKLRGTGAA